MSYRHHDAYALFLAAAFLSAALAAVNSSGQSDKNAQTATTPKAAKSSQKSNQTAAYQRPTDPSLYVGSETCKTCHEDMPVKGFFKNYEDSPHYVTTLDTKRGPEWHGCEACQGLGKEHVEGVPQCALPRSAPSSSSVVRQFHRSDSHSQPSSVIRLAIQGVDHLLQREYGTAREGGCWISSEAASSASWIIWRGPPESVGLSTLHALKKPFG
jgi:hypothetical protein